MESMVKPCEVMKRKGDTHNKELQIGKKHCLRFHTCGLELKAYYG